MGIGMIIEMASEAFPDRVALSDGTLTMTYPQLRSAAAGGGQLVRDSGAEHLVFAGVNSPALPVLLFSAAAGGVPFAPLNYRLSAGQLAQLIGRLSRPLVVADDGYLDALSDCGARVIPTAEFVARAASASAAGQPDAADDAVAIILFTSGTTAAPKGVLLRHRHLLSYILQTVEFGSAECSDAALVSTPPYHVAGMGQALSNIYASRRMVYLRDFTPAGWLDLVRSEGVSTAMVVPTMLARIVDHLDGAPANTPGLRSLAYGGARMPLPLLERALTLFPGAGFVNAYGLTETSSTIAVLGPDDHREALADPSLRHRLGSVGRFVPGVEGQVRDEAGTVLPDGATGQLWVRGSQIGGEYLDQGVVLDEAGWFPTRDQACIRDGFLYIIGRADDTIIRGGENIAPAEIEDVLAGHPQIQDVAVIGLPDAQWGERTAAVVVRRPGGQLSAEGVREFARVRLRGSRTPDEVIFADELPRTPTGKLVRRDLASAYAPSS